MMMKWYKVSEELPPINKPVFVAMPNYYDQYNENFVYIMEYSENGCWEYYDGGTEYVGVSNADRWAYIELPED